MIRAIETRYAGCRFRSRLEARWAVFFDTLRLPWEYEPEGFETPDGRYLPDFLLTEDSVWAEIKGAAPTERDLARGSHIEGLIILARNIPRTAQDIRWLCCLTDGDAPEWVSFSYRDHWPFSLTPPPEHVIDRALSAARSARFEHGESG